VALSDDQKAILRLLNQRGEQGYEDLSALMGIGVAEVHRRAQQAAAELEAEGIPAPVIPTPPGGGGGSPSVAKDGEAPAGEPPPPTVPSEPQRAKPKATKPQPAERRPIDVHQHHTLKEEAHRLKLLENRGLWAILAGVAIVVLFLVFIFAGGGDEGSDDGDTTTGSATQALERAAAREGKEVTKAVLNPVDGSDAAGEAIFGRVKNSLALQVLAEGLEETPKGESYTIWLSASEDKMLPLASTQVGEEGQIQAQVEVPTEVLAYLANETFTFIAVTKTDDSQLEASLAKATKERKAPVYTGTEVLRGEVTGPIVGAADRLEEEGKLESGK
jgi:hypothetical protein